MDIPGEEQAAPVRLDEALGDEDFSEHNQGRGKASWAEGHLINTGLPGSLPDWLYGIRRRSAELPRVVRRGTPHGSAARVDWARTLKRWAQRGHSDAALVWNRVPYGPGRVVVLWDVSGSMAGYADWYFPWLYRICQEREQSYVFAFGTDVADLTPALRGSYPEAVSRVYGKISLWGSGTAIGRSINQWEQQYGDRLLGRGTRMVIVSDGWDVGPPHHLEESLHTMAARCDEIWWLNPLMITAGFEARTRALKIALQYTQHMSSGATQEDLRRISWRLGLRA